VTTCVRFELKLPNSLQATWDLGSNEPLWVGQDQLQQRSHGSRGSKIHAHKIPCGQKVSTPKGYFDRTPTIHSHQQMMDRLKQRTGGKGALTWNTPVRQENDTGYQTAAGTEYVVRKTHPDGKPMYWAWHAKKLLGYSGDITIAQAHCEAHALGSGI